MAECALSPLKWRLYLPGQVGPTLCDPRGLDFSAFLSCAHPPPLSGGTCCGAVSHCAAPANRRLLFSTLLLPHWCADSAFDSDGVYTMDLLPDFQHGIPAPCSPSPTPPFTLPCFSFLPTVLSGSHHACAWSDVSSSLCSLNRLFFFLTSTLQIMFMSFFYNCH